MHRYTDETERVARAALEYARDRLRLHPVPLDGPKTADELAELAGATITEDGLGGEAAMRLFADVLAPASISIDNPRFLAFIPAAPTELSMLFDLVVGASSIYAGTWMEASGAVYAENQALRWLADLAGLPESAGGLLRAGRHDRQPVGARRRPARIVPATARTAHGCALACTDEAHSSVATAAAVMDVDLLVVPADARGRMTGEALAAAIDRDGGRTGSSPSSRPPGRPTSARSTTSPASPGVCREHGLWMHVDGAYGGAALAAPSVRDRFAGIEHADSFIVDPHKWLFAPFDCVRAHLPEPRAGPSRPHAAGRLPRARPGQRAGTRPTIAIHLTPAGARPAVLVLARRARHARLLRGDRAARSRSRARRVDEIRERPYVELLNEPELTVLVVRRTGWEAADYTAWTERLLADGVAFVTPTVFGGETVTRFAIVNPRTTRADIAAILDTMA